MNQGRARRPSAAACDPASRSVRTLHRYVNQALEGPRQERDDWTGARHDRGPFYPSRQDGQLPIPDLHSVAVLRGQRAVATSPVFPRIPLPDILKPKEDTVYVTTTETR